MNDIDKIFLNSIGEKGKKYKIKENKIKAISESVKSKFVNKLSDKHDKFKNGINSILNIKLGYGETKYGEIEPTFTQIHNKNHIFKPKISLFNKENTPVVEVDTRGKKVPSDMKNEIVEILNYFKTGKKEIYDITSKAITTLNEQGISYNRIIERGYPNLKYVKIYGVKPDENFCEITVEYYDEKEIKINLIKKEGKRVIS